MTNGKNKMLITTFIKKYPSMCFTPDNIIKYNEKKTWFNKTKKEAHITLNNFNIKCQSNITWPI
ncbi:MAG: hypothetical protein JXA54_11810 [Candidatus Heimdallarchaeota archaeon]|nr:hypothetical protein [Candidatus Heimdallarchaeota archaeon]